jgi:hypothetical protein
MAKIRNSNPKQSGGAEHTIAELDEEDLRTLEKEFDIVLD